VATQINFKIQAKFWEEFSFLFKRIISFLAVSGQPGADFWGGKQKKSNEFLNLF